MALINCPECGKQVSTAALACPSCGYPVAPQAPEAAPIVSNELLAEVRPSWWHYFWYFVFFWLVVPPFIAWWHRTSVVLRIYPGRITLDRGIFSKCYREFLAKDIRSLDIDQSLFERLADIGNLTISTAATVDASEEIEGIPQPKQVRELILSQRHEL